MPAALKDQFDRPYLEQIAQELGRAEPGFGGAAFLAAVLDDGWPELELKQRVRRISSCMGRFLPATYPTALAAVRAAAPSFSGLRGLPFPDFVEQFGREHWELSIEALRELTPLSTSELAVRPYLLQDPRRMLATMLEWTQDPDEHVRRLASEGCRPRLPWAMALPRFQRDPAPLLPILRRLRDDSSEYVRRSVANNLNDISKDHPQLVRKLAGEWLGHSPERDRLVKHACRSLLKAGDAETMLLFGFRDPAGVEVSDLRLSAAALPIGEELEFRFELRSEGPLGKIRLEYAVDFAKARGKTGRKVFKISESEGDGNSREVRRRHRFADLSTRRHYPGEHRITVIVNGREKASASFWLGPQSEEACQPMR